jgi:hypothetical protein
MAALRRKPAAQAEASFAFLLRLWPEDIGAGQIPWRGKIQNVTSGEACYFRDFAAMQAILDAWLCGLAEKKPPE